MEPIEKDYITKTLGIIFKEYRIKNKLTQEKIAEKLGISVKYISRIENGSGGVKIETLVNYINILGISPNKLFANLIYNDLLKQEIQITEKLSNLSKEKLNLISSFIDIIDSYKF